jgi:hypothetical protein
VEDGFCDSNQGANHIVTPRNDMNIVPYLLALETRNHRLNIPSFFGLRYWLLTKSSKAEQPPLFLGVWKAKRATHYSPSTSEVT